MGKSATWIGILVSAVLCFVVSAEAQDVPVRVAGQPTTVRRDQTAANTPALRQALQRRQVAPIIADPAVSQVTAAALNQVALEFDKDGEAFGKMRLGFPFGQSSLDIVIKGPISSKGRGNPLTQAGLSNDASARIGIHHSIWNSVSAVPEIQALADSQDMSVIDAASAWLLAASTQPEAARQALSSVHENSSSAAARVIDRLSEGQSLKEVARMAVEQGLVAVESSLFLSATYESGSHEFAWLDPTELIRRTTKQRDEAVAFSIGYGRTGTFEGTSGKQPLTYLGLSFSGGETHIASAQRTVCVPLNDNAAATTCEETAVSGPTAAPFRKLSLEMRQWIRDQKLGFNPQFIHDFEEDISRFEVNISALIFKKTADGNPTYELDTSALTGGARIGWATKSDRRGAYFAVFFSTVLGIW